MSYLAARLGAGLLAFAATPVLAQMETVIVTGVRPDEDQGAHVLASTAPVNAVNTEDYLKFAPSILVRKRHYGDTQDPIATRTSGVGASARSLIYVDGILISSPIGNNNSAASPHFGVAAPHDVTRIDVLYGPYAARYAGNSIGAVVNIVTLMPDRFEMYADLSGAVQTFSQYATDASYTTWQAAGGIGSRDGAFAWRLSANHLDSYGQPLSYATLARPAAASAAGTPVTGAFDTLSRTGAAVALLGAGSLEHQVQDTDTLKLTYDLTPGMVLAYTASLFHQQDNAGAQSYLTAGTAPVWSGAVNIGGYAYAVPASTFSNGVYNWDQMHLAQGLSLSGKSDAWDWQIALGDYRYLADNQRLPAGALPSAWSGGAGSINRLTGTGWTTLDASATWRGWTDHAVGIGLHHDRENFAQDKFNTADWRLGAPTSLATSAHGRTATDAAWLQDVWRFAPGWKAMAGVRVEEWRAYDGSNYSAAPALNVRQPALKGDYASPKASLTWTPDDNWTFAASYGAAWRMPTVTELYQAVTTGVTLSVPNPNLKPEHANSYDLSAQHATGATRIRLSLFQEDISNALLSQSAPLVTGSTTLYSYVQNVEATQVRGLELVAGAKDWLLPGLDLDGSLTWTRGRILKDSAFAAAIGKAVPQLPALRAALAATWHATDDLAFTLAGRYSDRSFATIDNSDPVANTWQGFAGYLVLDARVQVKLDENWNASFGIDNLNNDKYFLFHPFPQRTFVMGVHYAQ